MPDTVPRPVGWNTWDVQFHTGWTELPSGLRLRFGLRAADGTVDDAFTWRRGLRRLGPHTIDGGFAAVRVTAHDSVLNLEVSGGAELAALATVEAGIAGVTMLIDKAPGFPGGAVTLQDRTATEWVVRLGERAWRLTVAAPPTAVRREPGIIRLDFGERATRNGGHGGEPLGNDRYHAVDRVAVHVSDLDAATSVPDVPSVVHAARVSADAELPRSAGWLGDSAAAMSRALTWNTIFVPELDRVLTPTSRDFVSAARDGFYGRWALHTWDTFFTGLVASWLDPVYAEGIFDQICEHADGNGMLPNRVSDDRGVTADRSQPPVGGYTVLKAYLGSGLSDATRRRSLLERTYPTLRAWHTWWPLRRTGPHGLLAWGSDPVPGDPESATVDRAKRESGLDDSPMYDDVVLDPRSRTMNLADVGLGALHIADARALAHIARILGHDVDAKAFTAAADSAADRLQRVLWDAEHHQYRNRWADGEFSSHLSPTMLYPLLAGVPDVAAAEQLAADLLAPNCLGGDPPLPSTARNDPGFSATYWRGRVWAPMVFLAVEGLRRYDLRQHSRHIVDALLRLFLREWTRHSHVRENYPVGAGEDVRALAARSDGLMGWGGLLGYLAVQELADPRSDGWRFAHPGRYAEVTAGRLSEGRLSVRAAERLTVTVDALTLLDLPPGAVVTGYVRDGDSVRGVVSGADGAVRVGVPPGIADGDVELRVGDARRRVRPDASGMVSVDVPGAGAGFAISGGDAARAK